MKEFLFIFRSDYSSARMASPEEMQGMMQKWSEWMGGIAAQNKLADKGNRLGTEAVTLKPNNVVTDGPYIEMKESVGGYIVVATDTLDEAMEIAKGCPIFEVGGSVEVRNIVPMG